MVITAYCLSACLYQYNIYKTYYPPTLRPPATQTMTTLVRVLVAGRAVNKFIDYQLSNCCNINRLFQFQLVTAGSISIVDRFLQPWREEAIITITLPILYAYNTIYAGYVISNYMCKEMINCSCPLRQRATR